MSSYVLIMMVSAFWNTCPVLPTAGHYLVETLKYYGKVFNTQYMEVLQEKCISFKADAMFAGNELVVHDMFMPGVNAAANITQFDRIREAFARTYSAIMLGAGKRPVLESILILRSPETAEKLLST